jgi:hypothetical protein
MNDAQRYRMNAAECLSAAERCEPPYRGLTLAVAASWLSLARQQKAMDELLAIWSEARTVTLADTSRALLRAHAVKQVIAVLALRHGLLSRCTVLPWEDWEELPTALVAEDRPRRFRARASSNAPCAFPRWHRGRRDAARVPACHFQPYAVKQDTTRAPPRAARTLASTAPATFGTALSGYGATELTLISQRT